MPAIPCPACGTKNRIPAERIGQVARCGRCGERFPTHPLPATPVTTTDKAFASLVTTTPVPLLVDCWAPWCGPCRMVAPMLEELARELAGKLVVAKLNVDENPATAAHLGAQSIPTLVLFRGGREVDRLVGAPRAPAALREWLARYL